MWRTPRSMNTLVTCRCTHDIVSHENGGCSEPGCDCRATRYSVLDEAIDRVRSDRR